jgi:hypothetical protein
LRADPANQMNRYGATGVHIGVVPAAGYRGAIKLGRTRGRAIFGPVGCVSLIVALAMGLGTANRAAASASQGPKAHSAYGLQLSVPKSWTVSYFQNCTDGGPGTLLIGTPLHLDFCPNYPPNPNVVTMQPEKSEAVIGSHERHFHFHGLPIVSYSVGGLTNWDVSSKNVVITAEGPKSLRVLQSLRRATSRVDPAPGYLTGTQYVEAQIQAPVTGPVSVARLDARGSTPSVVQAFDGQFSGLFSPGEYRLTGHIGNTECPSVTAIVQSGRVTDARTIYCQGA